MWLAKTIPWEFFHWWKESFFHKDNTSLTVFNTHEVECASCWYIWIQYSGKENFICLPCSRSWHMHWAAPSISPALFPWQSLLEWGMLSYIQNTRVQDLKANSVDQSSAVVKYPLPQTCSQAAAHLSGSSCRQSQNCLPGLSRQNCIKKTHGAATVEPLKRLGVKRAVTGKALFVQREQTSFVQTALWPGRLWQAMADTRGFTGRQRCCAASASASPQEDCFPALHLEVLVPSQQREQE